MSRDEASAALSISPATAACDWQFARVWLYGGRVRPLRPDLDLWQPLAGRE